MLMGVDDDIYLEAVSGVNKDVVNAARCTDGCGIPMSCSQTGPSYSKLLFFPLLCRDPKRRQAREETLYSAPKLISLQHSAAGYGTLNMKHEAALFSK